MARNLLNTTINNRYRFDDVIGEGTFARVYRVYDLKRGVNLAAKVLREDIAQEPTFVQRFTREASVLQRLQHPNIVRYYDIIEADGVVFMLLEYVVGANMQAYFYKLQEPMTVAQTLPFIKPITAALHYAHGEGIIHRDIKPANILLGDNGNVYVTDFGIARLLDEAGSLTQDATIGTPLYMAPEQILGTNITTATDVYALGILLYQMLSGKVPFRGDDDRAEGTTASERISYEHLNLAPPSLENNALDISEAVLNVVLKCLKKEPTARYQSVLSIYDALAEAIGATPAELDAVMIDRQGKPLPPDMTLPEWSQVLGRVEDIPSTEPKPPSFDAPTTYGDDSNRRPTIIGGEPVISPALTATPSVQSTPAIPPPIYQPTGNSYAYARPRRSRSRSWLLGAGIGVLILLTLVICGSILWIGGNLLLESGNAQNPTSRPLTFAQQTSTALISTDTAANSTPSQPNASAVPPTAPSQVFGQPSDFVYAKENNNDNLDIFRASIVGGDPTAIISTDENESGPTYSPSGDRIAYYSYGDNNIADIWIANGDGSNRTKITNTSRADERWVTWSPDGTQIAFHSDEDGDWDIYIYDLATNSTRNVTASQTNDLGPSWSPDGMQIAFHSDEYRNFNEIFVINVDSSARNRISDGNWRAMFPTWSPDGSRIIFHANTNAGDQLFAVNPDGTALQPLFQSPDAERFADWASDGSGILYMAGSRSNPRVELLDFTTGNTRILLEGGFYPDWHP